MGWHAETSWDLTIDPDRIPDLVAEMNDLVTTPGPEGTPAYANVPTKVFESWGSVEDVTVDNFTERLIGAFHEDGELALHDDGRLEGWGSAKSWDIGPDPRWEPMGTSTWNAGGEGVYTLLARHCTGTIDWRSEDDHLWRIRLHGDGTWSSHIGEVVYPTDEP